MKKTIAVVIMVLLLLSLSGCGVRQKAADKVAEKIAEGILDKVTGDNVDVDLEDGKITVEGEDGAGLTVGGGEWPKDGAAAQIPEFKKGKINSVMNAADNCWMSIEEVAEVDYMQYVEALKGAGFENGTEYTDADTHMYSAYRGEELLVTVTYSGDGDMVIQVLTPAEQ